VTTIIFCFNLFFTQRPFIGRIVFVNIVLNSACLLHFYLFRLLQYSKYPNANAKATRRRVTVTAIAVDFFPADLDVSSFLPFCKVSAVDVIGVGDWLGCLEDILSPSVYLWLLLCVVLTALVCPLGRVVDRCFVGGIVGLGDGLVGRMVGLGNGLVDCMVGLRNGLVDCIVGLW
jgi:hypothetical protein